MIRDHLDDQVLLIFFFLSIFFFYGASKKSDEFVTRVDSSVPLMHHDLSDLGPLIQITRKERTL